MAISLFLIYISNTIGCIKLKLFASSFQSICQQLPNRKPAALENIIVNRVVCDPNITAADKTESSQSKTA